MRKEKCDADRCDVLEKNIRARLGRLETPVCECVSADNYLSYCAEYEYRGKKVTDYSTAVQMALNAHAVVEIPYREEPVYLRRGIIVNSGNTLRVHPETRIIYTEDGVVLRNRNVIDGHFRAVFPGDASDRDISVTGGIWEAPESVIISNRDPLEGILGCDSLFLLHNVVGCRFEHVRIRNSMRMGLMIGNCTDFIVNDVEFIEGQNRDGIHVEGPASWGIIRDIRGNTGDDVIALNAWDWTNSSLTFGSIHHVIVEKIDCKPGYLWSEMRLHPGNYGLPDGTVIECPVYDVILQDITGVHTVKLYNQPNLMPGYNTDKSFGLGSLYNLYFRRMKIDYYPSDAYYTVKNSCFEMHADGYNINLSDIEVNFPLRDRGHSDYSLMAVGPISATWKISDNPDDWFDFFDPDSVCHVDGITIENITVCGEKCNDREKLLLVRRQSVNPDYPKTTPAGGTGYGVAREVFIV